MRVWLPVNTCGSEAGHIYYINFLTIWVESHIPIFNCIKVVYNTQQYILVFVLITPLMHV